MHRDELEALYEQAGTLARLGELLGLTPAGARARLRRAGIAVRDARYRNGNTRKPPSADERARWEQRYIEAGSVSELARRMGLTRSKVEVQLDRHGIRINRRGYASPRTVETPTGEAHFNWKGGLLQTDTGYVLEYAPDHPSAKKGYVLQHRLVMEQAIGRYLSSHELVHHKNEVKTDNRLENLEIMSRSDHNSHHKIPAPRDAGGRFVAFRD